MIHLHGHSHYSLLEAIGKPSNIIMKAKELNMSTIGITDYNGMYGAIEFYQGCQKFGIKPLIGVELGLVHDISKKEKNEDAGTLVLLAKNYQGYENLLNITSHANLEGYRKKARIDRDILQQYQEHLIAFMGGDLSFLGKMILQNENTTKIQETIARFHDIFDNNFYLELIAQDEKKLPNIKKVNQAILGLSPKTNTKIICQTDYHYINPDDKEAAEVARAIKDGKRIYDDERRKFIGDYHITNENEVQEMMKKNGYDEKITQEALDLTDKIAGEIDIQIPLGTILFPKYESGEEIKGKYEKVKGELIEETDK